MVFSRSQTTAHRLTLTPLLKKGKDIEAHTSAVRPKESVNLNLFSFP